MKKKKKRKYRAKTRLIIGLHLDLFIFVIQSYILGLCLYDTHFISFCFRRSYVKLSVRHYPKIQEMLQYSSECAVCGESFLNTWLECVHFVDARKVR